MKVFRLFIAVLLILPLSAFAQDMYSNWFEFNVDKELGKMWDINAGAEVRTNNKSRCAVSVGAEFKPIKYLKLGVGYTFLNREGITKDHFNNAGIWNGYNYGSWMRQHRAIFDVVGTVKVWKWLRLSLRERYQFTHRPEQTVENRKVRYDILYDGEGQYIGLDRENPDIEDTDKLRAVANDHVLRSRLKLEVDKKKWRFSPFIYGELHNSLSNNMTIEKVRTAVGTEYKFNKHHSISAAYVLTIGLRDENSDDFDNINERVHAFNLGYNFKF